MSIQQLDRGREREAGGGGGGGGGERETERVDGFMLRIIALSKRARVTMGSQRFLEYNCGERDREVTTGLRGRSKVNCELSIVMHM